jgi:hypothetical protein
LGFLARHLRAGCDPPTDGDHDQITGSEAPSGDVCAPRDDPRARLRVFCARRRLVPRSSCRLLRRGSPVSAFGDQMRDGRLCPWGICVTNADAQRIRH